MNMNAAQLGLTGEETYSITGLAGSSGRVSTVRVRAVDARGKAKEFDAVVRIDTPVETDYYRHGGILPYMVRRLLVSAPEPGIASVQGVASNARQRK